MKPEHLAAIRRQRPDSIAPDGAPLMFIPVKKLRVRLTGAAHKQLEA